MKAYETTKIGTNRGAPRVWIEGIKAKMAGFFPGKRFSARTDATKKMLILSLADTEGERLVSKRMRGNKEIPIIDINSSELLSVFDGFETLRVIVQEGRIFLMPLASELAAKERLERLKGKMETGEPILVGSVSHGGGVLTNALHHGLLSEGVIAFENVKQYQSSASMYLLRYQLRNMGYEVHEEILQSADWGALEHRERLSMVAVTKGMSFDYAMLERYVGQSQKIGDVLDDIGPDHSSWSEMAGLKAKQERDMAAGKGFKMQIVTPFDTKCPTITKGYAKVRSTDPKLQHRSLKPI